MRIEDALATGRFQTVLGDREAVVDTYREFVVFDEGQIYPEYDSWLKLFHAMFSRWRSRVSCWRSRVIRMLEIKLEMIGILAFFMGR